MSDFVSWCRHLLVPFFLAEFGGVLCANHLEFKFNAHTYRALLHLDQGDLPLLN